MRELNRRRNWSGRLLMLAGVGLILAGCNRIGLVYDHLDWLAARRVNSFVALNPQQQQQFDLTFGSQWQQHRGTQLPLYAADLRALAEAAQQPISPEQLHGYAGRVQRHGKSLADEALPDSAALLSLLDDPQVHSLLTEIDRRNAKAQKKRTAMSDAQWRDERYDKAVDMLKEWTGDSSPAQRARIRSWADALRRNTAVDHARAKSWRNAFAEVLKHRRDPDFAMQLQQMFVRQDGGNEVDEAARSAAIEALIADVSNIATPTQRSYFSDRLTKLASDLEALAAKPPTSG